MARIDLSVVVPLFNEAEGLEFFWSQLKPVLEGLDITYEVLMIDDGSLDSTFDLICILSRDSKIKGIKLSRNFGHQAALYAGLQNARGRYILMMDGDNQHPPELIPKLWKLAQQGYDVVYTIRDNDGIGYFKKISAKFFYRLFRLLTDVPLDPNTADFRLINRRVCDQILQLNERDLFLRGLFSWVGFRQTSVHYRANPRSFGKTSYSLWKMLLLSISGITAFSVAPIRLAYVTLCSLTLITATSYSIYALYTKFILKQAVQGWTSLLILMSLYFSGTFILLGVIGEYIAKIHMEAKKRPRYIIADTVGWDN